MIPSIVPTRPVGNDGAFEGEAGVREAADQQRHDHDGERVVERERGDDDARVAVLGLLEPAGVEHVPEVADLAGAGEAGDAARDRHHRDDLPLRADARVVGRLRGVAHDPHLEAVAGGADEQRAARRPGRRRARNPSAA